MKTVARRIVKNVPGMWWFAFWATCLLIDLQDAMAERYGFEVDD